MKRLVEIPLRADGHGIVLAEIDDNSTGDFERAARDPSDVARELGGSLEAALASVIAPAAQTINDGLRKIAPDEITLEFGLKIVGKAGVVFASSEVEGHFQVTLVWKPPTPAADTGG